MKLIGFLVGAAVASVGVFAFNQWRHVSDDDRLTTYLRDHCLPYVTEGTTPFVDMGRTPGVYDDLDLRDDWTDGGAKLIEGTRFVVQWGLFDGGDVINRACEVHATFGSATVPAFEVDPDGFVARYTDIFSAIRPVTPQQDSLDEGPIALGWYENIDTQSDGLRIVMIASPGLVTSALVVYDVTQ